MKLRLTTLLAVALLALFPHDGSAQSPSVVLPIDAIHQIAVDFDQGLNPVYCYFGARVEQPTLVVRVDSVTLVASPAGCKGIGIGFFLRVTDRVLLAETIRGVITANPQFDVVSAFYQTEEIEERGQCIRAARALSIVRGSARRSEGRADPSRASEVGSGGENRVRNYRPIGAAAVRNVDTEGWILMSATLRDRNLREVDPVRRTPR